MAFAERYERGVPEGTKRLNTLNHSLHAARPVLDRLRCLERYAPPGRWLPTCRRPTYAVMPWWTLRRTSRSCGGAWYSALMGLAFLATGIPH